VLRNLYTGVHCNFTQQFNGLRRSSWIAVGRNSWFPDGQNLEIFFLEMMLQFSAQFFDIFGWHF
jgi:hypothetical protein